MIKSLTMTGVALLLISEAVAQSQVVATSDTSTALQEVVVTAQKRSENVQDIPIAITALSGDDLALRRVENTSDLQFQVPSLTFNSILGIPQIFLRGIGTDVSTPNSDLSVATYVDGAVVGGIATGALHMFAVDRTEVLAGPQGTLYGRNAVGGAINIVTLTPSQKFEATGSAGTGNYGLEEFEGHISGGLTDTLSVGLYGYYTDRDTYMRRYTPYPTAIVNQQLITESDTVQEWGGRGKAVWTPTDWMKFTLTLEKQSQNGSESEMFRETQTNALAYVAFGAPVLIKPYYTDGNDPGYRRSDQRTGTLREEFDLGWSKIVGISNYRKTEFPSASDFDTTQVPLITVGGTVDDKQWSQEVQLVSADSSKIEWITGLYYFYDDGGYNSLYSKSAFFFPAPATQNLVYSNANTKSAAVYGQATMPLDGVAQGLRLTLGARFTSDKKTFEGGSGLFLDDTQAQVGPTTVYPGGKEGSWNKFTPKVSVDYKWDTTLLYATYSQGFKAGAFNLTAPADPGPVNPETLNAYEIGTKSDLWNRRLRVNTAAYYYDYKDRQEQVQLPASVILQNAANAKLYGFELNILAAITSGLTFNAAIELEHTEYTSFPNAAGFVPGVAGNDQVVVDATGNQLQRAPKFVSTVGADYTLNLQSAGSLIGNVNWYHNGGYYWDATNVTRQDSYDLLNASINYQAPGNHWAVMLWGTNITNTHYLEISDTDAFGTPVIDAPPRMYGVRLKYQF